MLQHYVRIFLSLVSIGAILFFIYFALNKLQGNTSINKKSKRIRFIEQMYLSPGVVVNVISVDSQEFLVGVSNKSINFIQPLKEGVPFSDVLSNVSQAKDVTQPDDVLETNVSKKKKVEGKGK